MPSNDVIAALALAVVSSFAACSSPTEPFRERLATSGEPSHPEARPTASDAGVPVATALARARRSTAPPESPTRDAGFTCPQTTDTSCAERMCAVEWRDFDQCRSEFTCVVATCPPCLFEFHALNLCRSQRCGGGEGAVLGESCLDTRR